MDENNSEVVQPQFQTRDRKEAEQQGDALAKMQAAMEHAMTEDCAKLPVVWVNNFRLSFAEGTVIMVLSDAQDPTGRHMPRARVAVAMPQSMFEQMVEGVGPKYLEKIREVAKQREEFAQSGAFNAD